MTVTKRVHRDLNTEVRKVVRKLQEKLNLDLARNQSPSQGHDLGLDQGHPPDLVDRDLTPGQDRDQVLGLVRAHLVHHLPPEMIPIRALL